MNKNKREIRYFVVYVILVFFIVIVWVFFIVRLLSGLADFNLVIFTGVVTAILMILSFIIHVLFFRQQ